MKKAVYTTILNDYDELKVIKTFSSDYDWIVFTNHDHLPPWPHWQHRKVDKVGIIGSREIKILSHKFLPEYEETFYIDGSVQNYASLNFKSIPEDMLLFAHDSRDPWEEILRIIGGRRGDIGILRQQLTDYDNQRVPRDLEMFMGGLIYRRHTEAVKKFNESWWREFKKYPSRDQMSLYKVAHKQQEKGLELGLISKYMQKTDFFIDTHRSESRMEPGQIYYFTPSGFGKNFDDYGEALNAHCEMVPFDEDWIVVRDQDTMFFPTNHRRILCEAAMRYPDTGVFGAYTNRIGLEWQQHNGEISEDTDIMNHYRIAVEREDEFGSECVEVETSIAGFFMMFKKGTWKNVRFESGFIGKSDILFDWAFCQQVRDRLRMPMRIIKGLYLFHFYRFNKDVRDTSHIFKN